jgi:hypothetical protein
LKKSQSPSDGLINITEILNEKLGNTAEKIVRDQTKKDFVKSHAEEQLLQLIINEGYDPKSLNIEWPSPDPFFLNDTVLAVEVRFRPIGYKRKPGKHELTHYVVYDELFGWQLSRQWNLVVVYLTDQNGWVEAKHAKRKET